MSARPIIAGQLYAVRRAGQPTQVIRAAHPCDAITAALTHRGEPA